MVSPYVDRVLVQPTTSTSKTQTVRSFLFYLLVPTIQITPHQTIHYLEYNPKGTPPILLLHGLGATGASWEFQIQPLVEAGFHVIAPDIRGFGNSSYPGGRVRVSNLSADMVSLLQSLQVGPAHVVGLSMGGAIALQLALDAPNHVKSLVLVSTFASLRPKNYRLWLYYAFRFLLVHTLGLPTQARLVARRIFPHEHQNLFREEFIQQISQADPKGYRAVMRALVFFDVTERLAEINIPTLVVSGEEDTTIALTTQQHLSHWIPNAHHVIIPKGGHAITVEQPEVFNETMISFLQKLR